MRQIYNKTFTNSLQKMSWEGLFSQQVEENKRCSCHKKITNSSKNYWLISLLPICRKVLQMLLYNLMFELFIQNTSITPNQLRFKTGDSCINQLISITHEICKSFDDGYEVRGVFLDISKAFDKVWHQGLHYKLRQSDILDSLLNTLTDFLDSRSQRVILNGQYFSWAKLKLELPKVQFSGCYCF